MTTTPQDLSKCHGHVTPRPDGVRARCGGPAICRVCQAERAALDALPAADAQPRSLTDAAAEVDRAWNDLPAAWRAHPGIKRLHRAVLAAAGAQPQTVDAHPWPVNEPAGPAQPTGPMVTHAAAIARAESAQRVGLTDVQWLKLRTAETGERLRRNHDERVKAEFLRWMRFAERAHGITEGGAHE